MRVCIATEFRFTGMNTQINSCKDTKGCSYIDIQIYTYIAVCA